MSNGKVVAFVGNGDNVKLAVAVQRALVDGNGKPLVEETPQPRLNVRAMPCPQCGVKDGERCLENGGTILTYHEQRRKLAEKFPIIALNQELTATGKALICYYGFIMLADSCEAKSEALFGEGVKLTSRAIQTHFASQAIEELRKDGLLV